MTNLLIQSLAKSALHTQRFWLAAFIPALLGADASHVIWWGMGYQTPKATVIKRQINVKLILLTARTIQRAHSSNFGVRCLVPYLLIVITLFCQTVFACFAYSPMKTKMRPFNVSSSTTLYRNQPNERIRMTLYPTYGAERTILTLSP